jgi:hypothetical protein
MLSEERRAMSFGNLPSEMEPAERAFRLFPSERVLWEGGPDKSVPRDRFWRLVPALMITIAAICGSFAALLITADLPGARQTVMIAVYFTLTAASVWIAPSFLLDPCRFVVTDKRVVWKRGRIRRSIDRHALTFARLRWHPGVPTVGTIELVRAVPFGPLMRMQRMVLHDLRAPDAVLAIIRGAEPCEHGGDATTPLTDRLDPGEHVVWGGGPEGLLVDWRHVVTTLLGIFVLVVGLPIGLRSAAILASLEQRGLLMTSWTWIFLFVAMALTGGVLLAVGLGLAWHGVLRARAMGHDTEYVLTDRRLLIRRGNTELSIDRARIVDVAETAAWRGLTTVYLVLDGPDARALADSGAMRTIAPSRDSVPPVLYELRDAAAISRALFGRPSRPSVPHAA